jgi:hypothetical protein
VKAAERRPRRGVRHLLRSVALQLLLGHSLTEPPNAPRLHCRTADTLALDVRLPLEVCLGASNDVLNKRVVELAVRRRVESPRRAHQPASAGEVGAQARGKCLLRLLHHRLVQADAAALVLAGLGIKPPGHQLRRALLRRV